MTAVSVIVPARDAAATLGATLRALAAQRFDRPYEVIVVDDASTDATREVAASSPGPVTVLAHERALGPGPARNTGAAQATGEALAFTDADCVPEPDWLERGLGALEAAGLVQGAVRPDPAIELRPFDRSIWVGAEVGLYETANLFVTREAFDRVGGFEDWLGAQIGKPLAEDVWLGWRVRRAGARTVFSADALVHHAVFRRGPVAYVGERARLVYFPAMARKIPELRQRLFFARAFLNRRSAAFDAAVAGAVGAVALGTPLPLVTAAPYLWMTARRSRRWGWRAPVVVAVELAADCVGFGALVVGSLRYRTIVL